MTETYENEPLTDNETDEQTPETAGGLSPGLLLLLISGIVGLIAGFGMLLAEDAAGRERVAELDALLAPRPVENWEAPEITLASLTGGDVTLSDYEGQPVFVNFWATWCPPCVAEMPALQRFMAEADQHGAVVLALNVEESVEQIGPFLEDIGVTELDILLDVDSLAFRAFQVGNMPTTFIIDAEGMVRYFKIGEVTVEDLYGYLELIEWEVPLRS